MLAFLSFLRYIHQTAIPWCFRRFDLAAESASSSLREELLFLSRSQAGVILLLLFLIPGAGAAMITGNPWVGLSAGSIFFLLSGAILRGYRNRRRRRIASQLPGLLDILAGHMKAGHSFLEALNDATPLLPRGIREEISWIFQKVRVGIPLPEVLALWENRVPIEEVLLVVRPLRTALSTGSDAANLLGRCRDILQEKQTMEGRMKSTTAQSRMQAVVLTLLPPGFILALSRIDPGYLPRCLGTAPGIAMLAASAVLQAAGWLCIRKIMAGKP